MKLLRCAAMLLMMACGCTSHKHMGAGEGEGIVLTGGPVTGTRLSDLPAPVRDALRKQVPTGEVVDIDKQNLDGQMIYKFSFAEPGRNPALCISEDGKIVQGLTNRQRLENGR